MANSISSTELEARQQQYGQALSGRQDYLGLIKNSEAMKRARNSSLVLGEAETLFSSQARGINEQVRFNIEKALATISGLGGGLQEKRLGSVAASGVGAVTAARNQASRYAVEQQSSAEAEFAGMLQRLGQLDLQLTEMRRSYAERTFGTGNMTDISLTDPEFAKYASYISGKKTTASAEDVFADLGSNTGGPASFGKMLESLASQYGQSSGYSGSIAALQEEFGV